MSGEYPDLLPLERLVDAREVALRAGRRLRPGMVLCGPATLSFHPSTMRHVADDAPILTDIPRLKRFMIQIPEHPIPTCADWILRVDMTWVSWSPSGLAWFHEHTRYVHGTLEQLTWPETAWDPVPTLFPLPPFSYIGSS